jgi:hypothetical protein
MSLLLSPETSCTALSLPSGAQTVTLAEYFFREGRSVTDLRIATSKTAGRATGWLVFTCMTLCLPLAPFLAAGLARRGWYLAHPLQTIAQSWRHTRAMLRSRVVERSFERRVSVRREVIDGACTHCGRCCVSGQCVFLNFDEQGHSSCRIYGTRFWKALSCGHYPVTGADIAEYECPSFTARPVSSAIWLKPQRGSQGETARQR